MKQELTADLLRERLHYDAESGVFTWRVRPNPTTRAGDIAGYPMKDGYWRIGLFGKKYLLHRLAWLYMTGAWPSGVVDHRNTVRADNRWSNLRDVTQRVNCQNRRRATNSTGLLGVAEAFGRFQARVEVDGRVTYLGTFLTAEAAHSAYVAEKRKVHEGCTL